MEAKIYFITGVCGVGKTSVIPHLRKLLPSDKYDVRDFDERGVPDGADDKWRKSEIKEWLKIGTDSTQRGVTTIICGFTRHSDLEGLIQSDTPPIEILLLDADSETIRKRLVGRYTKDGVFDENQKVIGKPVDEFIDSNMSYCDVMRKECLEEGCMVIDTSNHNPKEVAKLIVDLIQT